MPKHIFEQQEDLSQFRNTDPVTLGTYTVREFDPNGFWQLWELREDWQRSAWGWMDQDGFMPRYVLYKDFGPEETSSLSFIQNQYDVDTFMSPDSIKAAQARNENFRTGFPSQENYYAVPYSRKNHARQSDASTRRAIRWTRNYL